MAVETAPTKVITGKVRFSYAHVFEPHAQEEGKTKKYSVAILIPKKDKATIAKINAAVEAATQAGKVQLGGKIPPNLKKPLRDGDEERPDDENYVGMMFLNASSSKKPGILDPQGNQMLDASEFYSGCYGLASINFYAFNTSGNKGIAAGLNNLKKTEDGENLGGGGASAESDFGEDNEELG